MFDYVIDNINNTPFEKEFDTKFISLENFFNDEHLQRLTNDVYSSKHLTMAEWPPEQPAPSVISFADMMDNDPSGFYGRMIDFFSSEEVKTSILKKFGITENIKKIQERTSANLSFHTEYPNQYDGPHTDQKDNLFTISFQIYLPTNDELKNYGTKFYDKDCNVYHTTKFLPNTGYGFLANNNSWHEAITGAERKSFFLRYAYNLNIEKTQTIFNYNPTNKICHVVWNKDMGIHKGYTDWMAHATLQNISKLDVENIVCTLEPFKRDIEVLRDLQQQRYDKAIVYFGGFIWHNTEFFEYVKNYDLKEIIIGNLKSDNSEFLRQCFVINLKRLDEIYETYARGKFFEEVIIGNNYVNIAGKNMLARDYYHPEVEQSDEISSFIAFSNEGKVPLSEEFANDTAHLTQYKEDNTDLLKIAKNIRQF